MKDKRLTSENASLRDKVADLLSLQLFNREVIETIYANTRISTFEPGEVIIREGETNSRIYFILSGSVKVYKTDSETIMRLRRHGDIIGLISFIDDKPHPFTASARERTECLVMDSELMEAVSINTHMDFHYIVYRIFTESLAEHLRMSLDSV
jgi:CRP-like cAMP-binding protein